MPVDRRSFLGGITATAAAALAGSSRARARDDAPPPARKANPIAVSTYSFWQFRGAPIDVEPCIDKAAACGFDGVELLHIMMQNESNAACQRIKRRAHAAGLPLIGLSTHQGFVTPDVEQRKTHIQKTMYQIELAYRLGIPTMRINTGRWGTIKSFDDFMAKKGIEPPLPGHTDEDAFPWVVEAIEKVLPRAEECGVVLGLENHWGLGRTAAGLLRIVESINSPWLQMTLDTGNFLEHSYEQIEAMAASKAGVALVQAKTYDGGGRWYKLDIDYDRVASILKHHGYRGWISLEFEGNDPADVAVPKDLALLRKAFG